MYSVAIFSVQNYFLYNERLINSNNKIMLLYMKIEPR